MIDTDTLEAIQAQFKKALPEGLNQLDKEVRQQINTALKSALSHLELVTREEFDAQKKVLQKTREKCEALEKQFEAFTQKVK